MITLNFILTIVLAVCILWAAAMAVLNSRRLKANHQLADDLDTVLQSTMEIAKRNKKNTETKKRERTPYMQFLMNLTKIVFEQENNFGFSNQFFN